VAIARNPLLRAVVEYGRRSMGDRLRFAPEGPRELSENLALAEGPEQFRTVAAVFEQLQRQEQAPEGEVRQLEQVVGRVPDVDGEADAALAGLDRMADLYEGPTGRRHVKGPVAPSGATGPQSPESPDCPGGVPGGEGDS
jgi:hypothetical protein